MHAVGRTVFDRDRVEEFEVEILGVLENAGPKQSIILARISGGPLAKTGVMQGMSGSPIYIDGKLVGALALAFPFATEAIGGIRPIEDMVRALPAAAVPLSARVSLTDPTLTARLMRPAGSGKLIDIATPLSFSGFGRAAIDEFAPQLRSLGLEPRQVISGGRDPEAKGSLKPLEPGSMISVQLMSGDMSVGADGTVTYIDGKRVYAFGHQFLSLGKADLPFARSSVVALLPNLNSSFKISSAGEFLGTITADQSTTIVGELDQRPHMVPIHLKVNGVRPADYRLMAASDPLLTPLLLQMALYAALDSTERTLGAATISVHGSVLFEGLKTPVRLENLYSGDFNVPLQVSLSTVLPIAYALQNTSDSLRIQSVDITVESFVDKKQLAIDQVWTSRKNVRPGESFDIYTQLTGSQGVEVTKTLTYVVPAGAPLGTMYITVADGSTTNSTDYQQFIVSQPRPAGQLISFLNRLRGNSSAYVSLWRADAAYPVQGEELSSPPPSVGLILNRAQSSIGTTPRTSRIQEFTLDAGDAVVVGAKTIQVDVKE